MKTAFLIICFTLFSSLQLFGEEPENQNGHNGRRVFEGSIAQTCGQIEEVRLDQRGQSSFMQVKIKGYSATLTFADKMQQQMVLAGLANGVSVCVAIDQGSMGSNKEIYPNALYLKK